MDLSFPHFDRDEDLVVWPADLAALMVGVAARQGASPTAAVQAELGAAPTPTDAGPPSFAPVDGAFNAAVAAALAGWRNR